MHSKNEYLKVARERYFRARTKKEKSQILDEYCSNTEQSGKYVIRKINRADLSPKQRKKKKETYVARLKLPWLRCGKFSIALVDKGLSLFWR